MNKEHEMSFPLTTARMHFLIETVDGEEETFVEVFEGFDLIQKLQQYATQNYKALFEEESMPVHYAHLRYIEYKHEQDGVNVRFKIDAEDTASATVAIKPSVLQDENAKKIAMIREVLDFDKEAESSVLRDLFK